MPTKEYAEEYFFDKATGLLLKRLLAVVEDMGPVGVDYAQRIYRYADGVWTPDGESEIKRRSARHLGERYRKSHAENALDVVRNRIPMFTDETHDTQYLNLPNGLLDWRTGELLPHDPEVPSTIRIPVAWHPDATCPAIDSWLTEVFPPDAISFANEVIGYALLNENPLHKAIMLYGGGRNGKGTYLRLVKALLGTHNVSSVTPQSLDDNRFRSAELYGKLANIVGDVKPDTFRVTEIFKQLTGGDLVTAERKYGQPFNFTCRALIIASFNKFPRSDDTSDGFFSRWVILPFPNHFPADKADISLSDKLIDPNELQGLLVHAVTGLRNVISRGRFELPSSVVEATDAFRHGADPVRGYASAQLISGNELWVSRKEMFEHYEKWANENDQEKLSTRDFYSKIEDIAELKIRAAKRVGNRGYVGVALRDVT